MVQPEILFGLSILKGSGENGLRVRTYGRGNATSGPFTDYPGNGQRWRMNYVDGDDLHDYLYLGNTQNDTPEVIRFPTNTFIRLEIREVNHDFDLPLANIDSTGASVGQLIQFNGTEFALGLKIVQITAQNYTALATKDAARCI